MLTGYLSDCQSLFLELDNANLVVMPCLGVGMTSGFGADGCATTLLYRLMGYKDR